MPDSTGAYSEREWLEGERYEDKFPTTVSDRPSYLRFCTTCDHPEGDHAGRANWHGPRRGPCWRDGCDCQRFTQPSDQKEAA